MSALGGKRTLALQALGLVHLPDLISEVLNPPFDHLDGLFPLDRG